ncbi:hypothetical protein D3C81_794020 [compost metagenome]
MAPGEVFFCKILKCNFLYRKIGFVITKNDARFDPIHAIDFRDDIKTSLCITTA